MAVETSRRDRHGYQRIVAEVGWRLSNGLDNHRIGHPAPAQLVQNIRVGPDFRPGSQVLVDRGELQSVPGVRLDDQVKSGLIRDTIALVDPPTYDRRALANMCKHWLTHRKSSTYPTVTYWRRTSPIYWWTRYRVSLEKCREDSVTTSE